MRLVKILLLLIIPLLFSLSFCQIPEDWWDLNWPYRIAINITNPLNEDLYDVPVKIVIDTASLISAGKMRDDCGDIRFVDARNITIDVLDWYSDAVSTDIYDIDSDTHCTSFSCKVYEHYYNVTFSINKTEDIFSFLPSLISVPYFYVSATESRIKLYGYRPDYYKLPNVTVLSADLGFCEVFMPLLRVNSQEGCDDLYYDTTISTNYFRWYQSFLVLPDINTNFFYFWDKTRVQSVGDWLYFDWRDLKVKYVAKRLSPLPYYLESGCGTSNTVVWVRIPYLPALSTVTIYMYYGNKDATSESNISARYDYQIDNLGPAGKYVTGFYYEDDDFADDMMYSFTSDTYSPGDISYVKVDAHCYHTWDFGHTVALINPPLTKYRKFRIEIPSINCSLDWPVGKCELKLGLINETDKIVISTFSEVGSNNLNPSWGPIYYEIYYDGQKVVVDSNAFDISPQEFNITGDSLVFYISFYAGITKDNSGRVDMYDKIGIDYIEVYFDWPQDPSINFGSEESIIAISSPENNKAIGEQHRIKASVPTTVTWVAFYYKPENETSWIFLYNDTTAEDGFYYDWNTTDLDEGWYEIYGETDQGPTQTVKFFIDHTPPEPKIYDPKPLWYYSVKVPIQVSGVDNFDIGTCYYAIDNKNYTEIDCGDLIYIWVDPGVHTAYFKVCDTVDHCVEEANQFMASQGFGGIAIRRPAPAPAARVVPPITIEKIIERRIEPYRRATIISGTISAISLLYLILSLIGLI